MIVFDRDKCVVISKLSSSEIIASGARDKRSGLYNLSSYLSNLKANSSENIESLANNVACKTLGTLVTQVFVI